MNMFVDNAILLAQHAAIEDQWSRTFFGLNPDQRFTLLIVVIGCITGVLCTLVVFVSSTINSIHRRRIESAMKSEMIERGMTADEIEKIIEANSRPNCMKGMSADDTAKVMKAIFPK